MKQPTDINEALNTLFKEKLSDPSALPKLIEFALAFLRQRSEVAMGHLALLIEFLWKTSPMNPEVQKKAASDFMDTGCPDPHCR